MRPRTVVAGAGALAALALTPLAWVDRAGGDRAEPAVAGATLFAAKGCSSCHVGPDSTPLVDAGPSLAAAPDWAGERIDGLSAAEYVEQSIRQPALFISPSARSGGPLGPVMPALDLSGGEVDALVDYLLQR